ncbi:phosphotransferase [Streptomyces sp. DSM 41527]|uniref:Phosphotransferase n=1 Tax=Streptomyces mooreae TaxID=3075523 RepID=A0ABU2TDY3_9ACTN|nr:phosphotransferase [Streptomyces sp. DSM 41527]MDT0459154.1 phosphotransferase [Streptomyces sp. DSM 41527]
MPDPSSSPSPGEVSAEQIADVLAVAYGWSNARVEIIPLGTETDNATADTEQGRVFVKAYPASADPSVMEGRVALMELGRASGSPFPAVYPDRDGRLIARHGGVALSVWAWVDASSLESPYTAAHSRQIGVALGRLHTALSACPADLYKPNRNRWWETRPGDMMQEGNRLLELIDALPEPSEDDKRRREQIAERIAQVKGLPSLQAALPKRPHEQVVHFDATGANLLWDAKDELAAIIDLQARVALPTWELGRVLYEPFTVVESDGWRQAAVEGVLAYAQEVPVGRREELTYCARMALLHNLTSWFGVNSLYGEKKLPGAAIYARFWDLRAQAAERMLRDLADIEEELQTALAS